MDDTKEKLNKNNLVATEVEIIPISKGYKVALVDYHQTFECLDDTIRFENNHNFKTYQEAHEFGFWWKKNR